MTKINGIAQVRADWCPIGFPMIERSAMRAACDRFLSSRGLAIGGHREQVSREYQSRKLRNRSPKQARTIHEWLPTDPMPIPPPGFVMNS